MFSSLQAAQKAQQKKSAQPKKAQHKQPVIKQKAGTKR